MSIPKPKLNLPILPSRNITEELEEQNKVEAKKKEKV
jgi:hypothetical protein